MSNKNQNYVELSIKWDESNNPEYPYETNYDGHKLQVRINDFPEEPLYSLLIDDKLICDLEDWPKAWKN